MITVYETERKNGSQSSNLYVFNRFPADEPPKEEIMNYHNETIDLLETNNQKNNKRKEETPEIKQPNKCKEKPLELDHTFVINRVPQPFVQVVKCFFSEAKTIEEYWHMAYIAAYRNNSEKETNRVLNTAIHAFKQLIRKLKLTNLVKNPIAYFYGIVDKKLETLYYEDLYEMGFGANAGKRMFQGYVDGELITFE
jgi:hypothetical protein